MRSAHSIPLTRLIQQLGDRPLVGAEIGVWQGFNANILLDALPNIKLFMVDSWDIGGGTTMKGRALEQWQQACAAAELVASRYPSRGLIRKQTSQSAAADIPDNFLDFVFIDADHGYESVCNDLRLWWPKVKSAGLFAGHDYGHRRNRTDFGVKHAVDEFAKLVGATVKTDRGSIWYWYKGS